jgi:hypothetical protein
LIEVTPAGARVAITPSTMGCAPGRTARIRKSPLAA